jgi:hypothetical protein
MHDYIIQNTIEKQGLYLFVCLFLSFFHTFYLRRLPPNFLSLIVLSIYLFIIAPLHLFLCFSHYFSLSSIFLSFLL